MFIKDNNILAFHAMYTMHERMKDKKQAKLAISVIFWIIWVKNIFEDKKYKEHVSA